MTVTFKTVIKDRDSNSKHKYSEAIRQNLKLHSLIFGHGVKEPQHAEWHTAPAHYHHIKLLLLTCFQLLKQSGDTRTQTSSTCPSGLWPESERPRVLLPRLCISVLVFLHLPFAAGYQMLMWFFCYCEHGRYLTETVFFLMLILDNEWANRLGTGQNKENDNDFTFSTLNHKHKMENSFDQTKCKKIFFFHNCLSRYQYEKRNL